MTFVSYLEHLLSYLTMGIILRDLLCLDLNYPYSNCRRVLVVTGPDPVHISTRKYSCNKEMLYVRTLMKTEVSQFLMV